ncbi:Protein phosphatase ImpM [Rhodovulum sp. P5]|uniref:type VI secretion system-associated protein TagF n=1 Tax=Rhodovulum sp. P5 TaxID=1564506 RepID=UPI0009C39FA7|nr:type VI secretion system-associated protein TagF [Rhodovulum sp. P5]ARE41187.1 Protein phosphatase ImpM [Rhodovulum sp. P5]
MTVEFGAYGKIPAMGDFLRIGLDPGFTRGWDGWLQSAMATARDRLGERWTACYMSAPIWRFTLPAGLLDDDPFLGVTMPSVDRVGRQFPLTLAARLPAMPAATSVSVHLASDACFTALEEAALHALEDSTDSAALAARLQVVPAPEVPGHSVAAMSGSAILCEAPDAGGLARALAGTLTLTQEGAPLSLWSCIFGPGRRLMTMPGLPEDDDMAALFDPEDARWTVSMPTGRTA